MWALRLGQAFVAACLSVGLCASGALAADIVETAHAAGQFGILLRAADAAGMTAMLKGPGPFTVFAPTDEAFHALPAGMLDMLLKLENLDQLKMMLGYHVLFGRLATKDLVAQKSAATTTIGQPVILERSDTAVRVNDARLSQPDVAADNGVIQVIDKVLIPAMPVQPKT